MLIHGDFLPPDSSLCTMGLQSIHPMRSFLLPRNTDKRNQWSSPKWVTRCWRHWWCLGVGWQRAVQKMGWCGSFQLNYAIRKNMIHWMHNMSSRVVKWFKKKWWNRNLDLSFDQPFHKVPYSFWFSAVKNRGSGTGRNSAHTKAILPYAEGSSSS